MVEDSAKGGSLQRGGYCVVEGRLTSSQHAEAEPDPLAVLIHSQFRAMLLSPAFPCLGGAGAVRRGEYRFGRYSRLGSSDAIDACAADLTRFVHDVPPSDKHVAVYVAAFDGPVYTNDRLFEKGLWTQLSGLRARDERGARADREAVSSVDEDDPGFFYSLREFFVVGFHPGASRWARRFAWPTLVFNTLTHVEPLRESGKYEQMKHRILARDRRLQGCDNPSLSAPQIAQFSGRRVEPGWECPVPLQ